MAGKKSLLDEKHTTVLGDCISPWLRQIGDLYQQVVYVVLYESHLFVQVVFAGRCWCDGRVRSRVGFARERKSARGRRRRRWRRARRVGGRRSGQVRVDWRLMLRHVRSDRKSSGCRDCWCRLSTYYVCHFDLFERLTFDTEIGRKNSSKR